MAPRALLPLLLLALLVAACGGSSPQGGGQDRQEDSRTSPPAQAREPVSGAAVPAPERPPEDGSGPVVVFLGDSLTAGLGVGEEDAFPAVLGRLLAARGEPIRVINAGVSGDTSAGGRRRLDWALRSRPAVVVVELGANDGLRGLSTEETEKNLRAVIDGVRNAGARALLLGIRIPPNYGPAYGERFAAIYPRLARELGVPLVPFLLAGVAGRPELNQADGIHPTAEGHRIVARTVLPYLEPLVRAAA